MPYFLQNNYIDLRKQSPYIIVSDNVLCHVGENGLFQDFKILPQAECDNIQRKNQEDLDKSGMSGYCPKYNQVDLIIVQDYQDTGYFSSDINRFASKHKIDSCDIQIIKGYDYMIIANKKVPALYKVK